MTANEIVRVYLRSVARRLASGGLTKDVAEGYERDLNAFCSKFGDTEVEKLRQHDLTEFLADHPNWKSTHTKRRVIAAVLACFRWARDEELIAACPYSSPRALRSLVAETRRPATDAEFRALMRVGSRPLKFALLFLYLTGCRTKEMRDLEWESVRIDGQFPHLHLAKHKTVHKTGKPRLVGLDRLAVRLLRALRRLSKSERVFVNCDGTPWTRHNFCRHLRRAAVRASLDDGAESRVTGYCLRHSYACAGIAAGQTADQVGHQLGHASGEMVSRIYARHVGQDLSFISGVAVQIARKRS